MTKHAYPPWPHFEEDEIQAVENVLRSGKVNYWTSNTVKRFEQAYCDYTGVAHAIALANGTLALELALVGLDIGNGDEVIVPCRGFIATASCVVQRGAVPVLADVDPLSQNISIETLLPCVTTNTRAIIVVHHAGWPVDIEPIQTFCQDNGIYLIEDCAQAHGARYDDRPIGSFGDVAAFSFCQDKIISTGGEGGMVLTNDEAVWKRMWAFKDHGKSYDAVFNREHPPGFRWLHESFGTNWRMTAMQAAIGVCQLGKLDEWIQTRRENAKVLIDAIKSIPGLSVCEPETPRFYHAYYKFYFAAESESLRDEVMQHCQQNGFPCFVGSCANFSAEKAFQQLGLAAAIPMPNSEKLSQHSLVLLVHPGCDQTLMQKVADCLNEFSETTDCLES